jgi:hypothetical protein
MVKHIDLSQKHFLLWNWPLSHYSQPVHNNFKLFVNMFILNLNPFNILKFLIGPDCCQACKWKLKVRNSSTMMLIQIQPPNQYFILLLPQLIAKPLKPASRWPLTITNSLKHASLNPSIFQQLFILVPELTTNPLCPQS